MGDEFWGDQLPTLSKSRLTLRWMHAPDLPDLFAVFSDPEVMRYWSSPPLQAMAQAERLLQEVHDLFARRTLFQWGVALRHTDRVIGTCTLFHLDVAHRRAEIGYAFARAHWGKGLAREAVGALAEFAFGPLDLHRLEADVDPRNERSLRLLTRMGFVREGVLRERYHVAGEVQDAVLLGLLRPEWEEATGRAAAQLGKA